MSTERQEADALAEKRYAPRKAVLLKLSAWVNGEQRELPIRDLSQTGFLTESALELDQTIELELPHAGRCEARVVWSGSDMAGCTFTVPITKASLGAALLKSEFVLPPAEARTPAVIPMEEELPEVEQLPLWGRIAVIGSSSVALWSILLGAGWILIA